MFYKIRDYIRKHFIGYRPSDMPCIEYLESKGVEKMNKIKVIDLLNMISKGEELPSKIMYQDKIYYMVGNNDYENYEYDEEPTLMYAIGNTHNINDEIERLNNILKMLKDKLDFVKRQEEEKLNRIERCMAYNNYILHENWYGGNEKKYAQRNIDILLGKETELKEIPRVGSDKEC